MKNILKLIITLVGIALVFNACQKEGDLPFYKTGTATVLTSSATAVNAAVADSSKTMLSLNWTWPNYATDSINQKFIVQIAPEGKNFASPVTRVLKGVKGTTFTAKELNKIVFGFGDISAAYPMEMRIISSYANNNEQYTSNSIKVSVTPYIIPVSLKVNPTGPLTLLIADASNTAITCTWNATAFGNLPLNYAVQIDKAGGTFASPVVKTYGTALSGGITVNDLNRAAISAGISPNTTGDLSLRVVAYQGTNFTNPVYSNVVTVKVTTYLDEVKFWVVGGYNGWDNSDKALYIMNTPTTGANAEGYVNFPSGGEFKLTTNHSWDDAHTYGDDGTNSGKLSNVGGGKNIALPSAGYYYIKANPLTMTYSLVPTVWGVIGDATPGGWSDQTNMTYNAAKNVFTIGISLTGTKAFKFRGTSDWAFNYGSNNNDGKLQKDGSNIPVDVTADYFVTLDLSSPNNYTFTAYRWGIIGNATPGGWDNDTNMTWDATKKVFTVTLNLSASGKFKFRANDDWVVNYGGDLSALSSGGSDIAVPSDGNYTVTFDPINLKATLTKN